MSISAPLARPAQAPGVQPCCVCFIYFYIKNKNQFLFAEENLFLALANRHSKIVFGKIQICHQRQKNSPRVDFSQTQEALRIEIRSLAITGKLRRACYSIWRWQITVEMLYRFNLLLTLTLAKKVTSRLLHFIRKG